jgi:1,2-diacylglycerol 3-beta-galactosyltransferase
VLAKPHPQELVFQLSGLPIHPAFYENHAHDRNASRLEVGLQPELFTGLMMYGTAGSKRMLQLARTLEDLDCCIQMIYFCGHNPDLAEQLSSLHLSYPHLILTYTDKVPAYFSLADFLICKPGPGSISEAQVSNLALLIDCQNVLPQERYNLKWVQEHLTGCFFKDVESFSTAIHSLHALFQKRALPHAMESASPNRAIFEISAIIQRIVSESCENLI